MVPLYPFLSLALTTTTALVSADTLSTQQTVDPTKIPENCCTLKQSALDASLLAKADPCASIKSAYGTFAWQCKKGVIVYNGQDLAQGLGDDQISMHVDSDPHSANIHFTVAMLCTTASGKKQMSLPLYCPTLSTKQMVGLGPIFAEPCKDTPVVTEYTPPMAQFACSADQDA